MNVIGRSGEIKAGNSMNLATPRYLPKVKTQSRVQDNIDEELELFATQLKNFDWQEDIVLGAAKLLQSNDENENLLGVQKFKKMLCIAREQVFEIANDVIKSGVIPQLVKFITNSNNVALTLSSTFCLTNVAAGDDNQTDAVVAAGAIPALMELLNSRLPNLRRQAIFCLANIAGSTANNRKVLSEQSDYVVRVTTSAAACEDASIDRIATWNIRNMCVLPGADYIYLIPAVAFFADVLTSAHLRSCEDIHRYCFEGLIALANNPLTRHEIVVPEYNLPELCFTAILQVPDEYKGHAIDLLTAIAKEGDYTGVFTGNGVYQISSLLADPDVTCIQLRVKITSLLKVLSVTDNISNKFFFSPSDINSMLRMNSLDNNKTNLAQTIFNIKKNENKAFDNNALDRCIDVFYQRYQPEDPLVRQTAGYTVCGVICQSSSARLLTSNRLEELVGVMIELLEFNRPFSELSQLVDISKHSFEELEDTQNAFYEIVLLLSAVDRMLEVGLEVKNLHCLVSNPISMLFQQMGISMRLNEMLSMTDSADVSQKIVQILSRNYEI